MPHNLSPRAYRCPVCQALPGDACHSAQPDKVEHSHQPRQDRMIWDQWDPYFTAWLSEQGDRQDPVGDLARDVRSDAGQECLPSRTRTASAVRRHLVTVHGSDVCDAAVAALDRAETEWEAGR